MDKLLRFWLYYQEMLESEYSPLGKELKAQNSSAEKQYQALNKIFEPAEKEEPVTIKKEKPEVTVERNLIYDSKYSFSEYSNVKRYYSSSFVAKYNRLVSFYHRLNKFRNLVPLTVKIKMKKEIWYKNAVNLFNKLLSIYFNEYNSIKKEI